MANKRDRQATRNKIKELDDALRLFWFVVRYDSIEVGLSEPEIAPFTSIIKNCPDLFVITSRDTLSLKAFSDIMHNVRQKANRKWDAVDVRNSRIYYPLVYALEKIKETLEMTWTFTYPVPRDVFTLVLATCDYANKLPPIVGPQSKYGASICCLIDDFEVTTTWVRHKRPAPRFTTFSPPGKLHDLREFFYDFLPLMDKSGIEGSLVKYRSTQVS
ncbi:hypothetical protein BIW11_05881 [Tropilaelaps mercedesae]|uniref:Uncharacterized protein n=1 Tax=Tropilaelaps mercedesae TaxID=418985 RepID=A0A1V9Y0K8_9ACAR|nr:hypothetical protein BIW11_05881 [Tropilaelaps mercedesae]